jgi:hypothetical protein
MNKNTDKKSILGTLTPDSFSGVWESIAAFENLSFLPPSVLATDAVESVASITLPASIQAGSTIVIFAAHPEEMAITSPTDYTRLQGTSDFTNNGIESAAIFYKLANGTEGGTNVTLNKSTNLRICYAILDRGSPDSIGTNLSATGVTNALTTITPERGSLIFIHSGHSSNVSTDPTLSDGTFSALIDAANNLLGEESYIWSKVSDGLATGNITVTWPGSGGPTTSNICSFERQRLGGRGLPTLVSTSLSNTANTITLGQVNKGNIIVLFITDGTAVAPTGFTYQAIYTSNNPSFGLAYKTATGTETTLTGTWTSAISMVVDGKISGISDVVFLNVGGALDTSAYLQTPGLVALYSAIDTTSDTITSAPAGWTQQQFESTTPKPTSVLYTKEYSTAGSTGTASITWNGGNNKNAFMVSFYK